VISARSDHKHGLKVGGDCIAAFHGDGRVGIVSISNGAYIASPFQELVICVRLRDKVKPCVSGMDTNPLTGFDYRTT